MGRKRASQEQERKPQEEQEELASLATLYPLAVTSVVENEDGSLEVSSRGRRAHLQGEAAHQAKLATSSAYRAQQEQPTAEMTALQLVRKLGALG